MKFILFCVLFVGITAAAAQEQQFQPYIINGVRSPVAPYFAYIRFFQGTSSGWGGGALISNQHIVTSATVVAP
jgi:hypothetical protein